MSCLLILLTGAVVSMPLPLPSDTNFDIYPKTSISNVKKDSSKLYTVSNALTHNYFNVVFVKLIITNSKC